MTQKTIDYFFGMGSPWAYLGLEAFAALAKAHEARIEPHIIPLIEENGGIYSRDRPALRRAYWLTDLKRWAGLRGLKLEFSGRERLSDPTQANGMVVACYLQGQDWLALALALHHALWSRAEDIGNPEVRIPLATSLGLDGAALEQLAGSDAVAARRQASYDKARNAGVFGLPTYLHGGELFWGQDSLPFLDRHLRGEKLIDS
jgi:2-hydroxychromene-2-carboxylate isomerase